MQIGTPIDISGYVTKEKYVRGRTLAELERLLGFAKGRLSQGVIVAKPRVLPGLNAFEPAGYSQVAQHRHSPPSGLDYDRIRRNARESWTLQGPESLVKFRPNVPHDTNLEPDVQYPPGQGIPQWRIKASVPGAVVALIVGYPNGRYL